MCPDFVWGVSQEYSCEHCYTFAMFKAEVRLTKVAATFVLLLSLLSTGVVIAKECHSTITQSSQHLSHHHSESDAGTPSGLLTDICVGVTFLTLLIGGRFLLRIGKIKGIIKNSTAIKLMSQFIKPPNIRNALTLTQLGLCRI